MKHKTNIIPISIILSAVAFSVHAVTLEAGIPGQVEPGGSVSGITQYINYIYIFVLGFAAIAGFASIVFWGAVWAGSGVVDKKSAAIDGIKNALTGLALALLAFIILYTINPDLTVIRAPSVPDITIKGVGKNTAEGTYQWAEINPNRDNQSCVDALGPGWQTVKDESACGDRPFKGNQNYLYFTYQKLPADQKFSPYVYTCCLLPKQLSQ